MVFSVSRSKNDFERRTTKYKQRNEEPIFFHLRLSVLNFHAMHEKFNGKDDGQQDEERKQENEILLNFSQMGNFYVG